ncbi:hypothetical protein B0T19DRAFT_483712 [Cercophora scortea]|uniref:Uncharacterized protein n=1 Tax=Cercophora scortea TaxID=314031 RepID=A0AAE0MJA0_9PEZI|nr:hypothetical protein B0T19DRAFT_483712 [Cercophora scortea]
MSLDTTNNTSTVSIDAKAHIQRRSYEVVDGFEDWSQSLLCQRRFRIQDLLQAARVILNQFDAAGDKGPWVRCWGRLGATMGRLNTAKAIGESTAPVGFCEMEIGDVDDISDELVWISILSHPFRVRTNSSASAAAAAAAAGAAFCGSLSPSLWERMQSLPNGSAHVNDVHLIYPSRYSEMCLIMCTPEHIAHDSNSPRMGEESVRDMHPTQQ